MINDLGVQISKAEPSTPFELLGFHELPEVGALITPKPTNKIKEESAPTPSVKAPFDMNAFLKPKDKEKKLTLIIKAESQGSLEAILHALEKSNNIEILFEGVGDIHKSD